MATGVSDVDVSDEEFFATQDKAIEEHIQMLHRKLDEFEGLVKSTMRSVGRKASPDYLTMTFLFLTQIFRNLSDAVAAKGESSSDVAKYLTPQTGPATTSTTPASSSTAAASSRPPISMSQRTSFTAETDIDIHTPNIRDLKLLPGGLAVVADGANRCVKLFTIAGQETHSETTPGLPSRLAIVDVTGTNFWQVAATLSGKYKIAMLAVARRVVLGQRTIPTSRNYVAIAAVDSNTFAVVIASMFDDPGIDLIDHTGNVIRQISSHLDPRHMVWSPDNTLVMTLGDNSGGSIAKVNIKDGSAVYKHRVEQVKKPYGITCTQDGSCIVTDSFTGTLHLVTSDGVWVRQLWAHPAVADDEYDVDCDDGLNDVCVFQNACLCCTLEGSVFVLDIS